MDSFRKRSLLALILAGALLFGTGCNSKPRYILQGSILENAVIASVDGDLSLVRWQDSSQFIEDHSESVSYNESIKQHQHYFDITNGEWITDEDECINPLVRKVEDIEITGSILDYLTPEELKNALNKQLGNADIVNIITRIRDDQKENTLTLTP